MTWTSKTRANYNKLQNYNCELQKVGIKRQAYKSLEEF